MGQLRTRKRGSTWEWSFEGAKINGKRNPISQGGYRTKATGWHHWRQMLSKNGLME